MDTPRRLRTLQAFRNRDFRARNCSRPAHLRGSFALALTAHSGALVATLLLGGVLADRYSRRLLMIVADVARFVVIGGLAALDFAGELSFAWLVAGGVAFGLAEGFFYPAFGSIVPLTVEEHDLASANALISVSRQSAFVVGPALAGSVYALFGSATVFAFDAWTFLVSAALLLVARPRPYEREHPEGVFRELAGGFRYVARVPWLWVSILLASFILMIAMAPFISLLPVVVQEQFDRGVGAYGTLNALQSVGMAAGAVAFAQLHPRRHRMVLMYGSWAANDLITVAMMLTGSFEIASVLIAIRGALIGFGSAAWGTLMMELVPTEMLGRVTSLDFFGSFALVPIGYALTAAVSDVVDPATLIIVGFATASVLWSAPLLLRSVRQAA